MEIPADLVDQAKKYREALVEQAVELDEAATEAYLEGEMPSEEQLKALHPQGHDSQRLRADLLRLGLQEQGCAAAARRGG